MERSIEVFKPVPVPEFAEKYKISNYGRLLSLDYRRTGKPKFKQPCREMKGYLQVELGKINNKRIRYKVQRLVALAFLGEPPSPEKNQVNHKDENKENNFVWVNEDGTVDLKKSNLEWTTPKENSNWGTGIERGAKSRINHKSYSIPVGQLNDKLITVYLSAAEASRQTNIPQSNITYCCQGKRKTAGGYIWKYI